MTPVLHGAFVAIETSPDSSSKVSANGPARFLVGCAGWNIPAHAKPHFSEMTPSLKRYAERFSAVEINSSFYRPHRRATYARWADIVPARFQFSVKAPKEITHALRLMNCEPLLERFVADVSALGSHLGCILFQLPPRLFFESHVADAFFLVLRGCHQGPVVVEPRHVTWFAPEAEEILVKYGIARVAADPKRADGGDSPGGEPSVVYYRLHGSPETYVSAYSRIYIASLASQLEAHSRRGASTWCIFDNTARGAATLNALELVNALEHAL